MPRFSSLTKVELLERGLRGHVPFAWEDSFSPLSLFLSFSRVVSLLRADGVRDSDGILYCAAGYQTRVAWRMNDRGIGFGTMED